MVDQGAVAEEGDSSTSSDDQASGVSSKPQELFDQLQLDRAKCPPCRTARTSSDGESMTAQSEPASAFESQEVPQSLQYTPLSDKTSTRILRLHPAARDSPLHCSLAVTNLRHNDIQYDALSYVWGKEPPAADLTILDVSTGTYMHTRIRPNLAAALKRLRDPLKPRALWVDALCINQLDPRERGEQVEQMALIFSQATRVLVWLGTGDGLAVKSSIRTIEYMVRTIRELIDDSSGGPEAYRMRYRAPAEQEEFSTAHWQAVAHLFAQPWFRRLWCIQEIALARSAILLWGHDEEQITWDDVSYIAAVVIGAADDGRLSIPEAYNAYFLRHLREPDHLAPKLSLMRMLSLTRHYEVSDERDRVYAMLGLMWRAEGTREPPGGLASVDYTKTLAQLYFDVAAAVVEDDGDLLVLSCVQHCDPGGSVGEPSWVPQWHEHAVKTLTRFDEITRMISKSEIKTPISATLSKGSLWCDGLVIDEVIGSTAQLLDHSHEVHPVYALRNAYEQVKDFLSEINPLDCSSPYSRDFLTNNTNHRSLHEALFQSLRGGPAPDDHSNAFYSGRYKITPFFDWMSYFPDFTFSSLPATYQEKLSQAARNLPETCMLRRLYVTKQGFLGLGPAAMRAGDSVCLLLGAGAPMVLRERGGYWVLVGETYVHGGDGASMPPGSREEERPGGANVRAELEKAVELERSRGDVTQIFNDNDTRRLSTRGIHPSNRNLNPLRDAEMVRHHHWRPAPNVLRPIRLSKCSPSSFELILSIIHLGAFVERRR